MIYTATMMLGVTATFTRMRFGKLHHMLYALTCVVTALAVFFTTVLPLLPLVACLAAMPWCSPRRRIHAIVGITGFLAAFLPLLF